MNPFLWWKCLDCLNWNKCFFSVQSVDRVGRCTTSYLLAGLVCLWRLVYFIFGYLTHETRTINTGGLLIANHLDQSLRVNQKRWPEVRSYLLYPFRCLLLSHRNLHNYDDPHHFHDPSRYRYFDFSSSNFTVQITYQAPLEMLLHIELLT